MDRKSGDVGKGNESDSDAAQQGNATTEQSQDDALSQLLDVLCRHGDKQAAIAALRRAIMSLKDEGEIDDVLAAKSFSDIPLRRAQSEELEDIPASPRASSMSKDTSSTPSTSAERDRSAARSGPAFVQSNFPGCKRLEDAYRKIYHIPNKTPLSVLYEYASRLNLTLVFEEMQDSAGPGPFTVQTMLKDANGNMLHRTGTGAARSKKDAKQLAAATLLEHLLEVVPFQDLLYKSDKQQQLKDLQESRMRWLPAARTRCAPARPAGRPGQRLPPLFSAGPHAAVPISQQAGLPGPGQVNLPIGLLPSRQACFDAPQEHRMLPNGLPGHDSHYQGTDSWLGAAPGPLTAARQPSPYPSNRTLQAGELRYSQPPVEHYGMHRDAGLSDGFLAYELASNIQASAQGGGGGNASVLEACKAALTREASQQQQQQHQHQQLVEAHERALLQQDLGAPSFSLQHQAGGASLYPGGPVYLDPQLSGSTLALEDLLLWPNGPSGQF